MSIVVLIADAPRVNSMSILCVLLMKRDDVKVTRFILCLCCYGILLIGVNSQAFAQVIPDQIIPNSLQPDVVDRQFDRGLKATSSNAIIIPAPSDQLPPDAAANTMLQLNAIALEGNKVFPESELSRYYQRHIGREVNLATVFAIANAITAHYADAGYALSLAYVPAQEIGADGKVRLIVVEGYVGEVVYTGDVETVTDRMRGILASIESERPLTVATMERALLLATREPGMGIESSVDRSSIAAGALRLIVDVEHHTVSGAAGINNRGSRALGPVVADALVSLNGLLGLGEKFSVNVAHTPFDDELTYFGVEASLPIGVDGTRLTAGYAESNAEPGSQTLRLLEFNSDSTSYFVELYHPFILSRAENFNARIRFDMKDSQGTLLSIANTDEKLRSLRVSGSYDWVDEEGVVTLVNATFSQGVGVFGGSANDSLLKGRDLARYDYSKISMQAFQVRPLTEKLGLFINMSAQMGFTPLVASEQCGYGGGSLGRAFDSYEISGDNCLKGGAELRYMHSNPMNKIDYIQLYAFADAGKLWLKQPEGTSSLAFTAYSVGAGVRTLVAGHTSAYVEVALPLKREVQQLGHKNPRIFAGLRVIF